MNTITTVYRIQNNAHDGYLSCKEPNIPVDTRSQYLKDGTERRQHPDADTNSTLGLVILNLYNNSPFIFGFENLQHLYIWFTKKQLDVYAQHGFHVYKIKVESHAVIKGTRQLIFHKHYVVSEEIYRELQSPRAE